jgi:cell division protein FtsQ
MMPPARRRTASSPKTSQKPAAPPRRKALVRRRRLATLAHAVQALVCFALLGGIGYAFTEYMKESPRFKVSSLQIEGLEVLSAEEVRAVSGITSDDSLLLLEIEEARRRVEEMPYVRECTIQRAYPDSILIRIVERKAIATVLVNHRSYEVDEEGTVLRELDPLAPHTGPLITELAGVGFVEEGMRIDQPALEAALGVWKAFSASTLASLWTVSEIVAPAPDAVRMFCDELPFEIRWGRENFARQVHVLEIWWRARKDDPLCSEYVDLRFGADSLACK